MSRTVREFLKVLAAGLVLVGAFAGCDDDIPGGVFECGAEECLGASEYCETVLPDLSNVPISEMCKSIPAECSDLAPAICSPDDDASEEALAECVQESVGGSSGFSWSCFLGDRELFITIIQDVVR